jgi:hypothetical protein
MDDFKTGQIKALAQSDKGPAVDISGMDKEKLTIVHWNVPEHFCTFRSRLLPFRGEGTSVLLVRDDDYIDDYTMDRMNEFFYEGGHSVRL